MLYTIKDLRDDISGVNIRVRIISKEDPRKIRTEDGIEHFVIEALVGDRTGTMILSLWDEKIKSVDEGDLVDITMGYTNQFKGRLRLNISRYGGLEKVEDLDFPTSKEIINRKKRKKQRQKAVFNKS